MGCYEPPETIGDAEDCPEGADGDCEGCWSPLPEFEVLEPELDEFTDDSWPAAPPVEAVWPWNDLAAASEIAPVSTTAPATTHRLTCEILASPASRTLVALGLTIMMIGGVRKKLLNRR